MSPLFRSLLNYQYIKQHFSFWQLALILIHFAVVFLLSIFTPLILRYFFTTNFVEHYYPLEFTFQTCSAQLAGVCSFPEAQFALEDEQRQLQPSYYYSFVLDLILFDTMQNRGLSMVIANIQLLDEQAQLLANFQKSVPIFRAFVRSQSFISYFYTMFRNLFFWPLWIVGFFSTNSYLSDQFTVYFPNFYLERKEQPTRHIIVQLQNKFIQLAQGNLRVRTHVGLFSYILCEYPIISYILLFVCCFAFYSASFLLFYCLQFFKRTII